MPTIITKTTGKIQSTTIVRDFEVEGDKVLRINSLGEYFDLEIKRVDIGLSVSEFSEFIAFVQHGTESPRHLKIDVADIKQRFRAMESNKKVFLGGTCNNSKWRDELIKDLDVPYFNPVVEDWTPECQEEELRQRRDCEVVLYVITPLMKGTYSIAEAVDDSNKRPKKTVFCFLEVEPNTVKSYQGKNDGFHFYDDEIKSLNMVKRMISENGAKVFDNLKEVAKHINLTLK